jgi:hypothetical protein
MGLKISYSTKSDLTIKRRAFVEVNFGSLGIAVIREISGGVFRVELEKHPHIWPLPQEILKNLNFGSLRIAVKMPGVPIYGLLDRL